MSSSYGSDSRHARVDADPPGAHEELPATPAAQTGSLPALLRAVQGISSGLDPDRLLDQLLESACDLVGARYGALAVERVDGTLERLLTHGVRGRDRMDGSETHCDPMRVGSPGTTLRLTGGAEHLGGIELPADHPDVSTLLVVPVHVRGAEFGRLYVSEKRGGAPFTRGDQDQLEALAQVTGFALENAHAYALSERRRRWLEIFGDLSEVLQPPASLSSALARVVYAVRLASDALASAIVQIPDQGSTRTSAQSGDETVFSEPSPDLEAAVRSVAATGEVAEHELDEEVRVLMAPLRAHLAMPGVLIIAHHRSSQPDYVEERDLLSSIADHVALSLDRTQALREREQMAVVADRDRIARELHDVVIQRLFATGLHLQSVRSAAPTPELKTRIGEVVVDVDQTIRDIRNTIFSLQSQPQDSVRAEVREVAREFVPRLGFAPSVHLDGPVDRALGPQVQPVLMAVLREALTNVASHAQAGSAWVDLRVTDEQAQLRVTDNGRGIPEVRRETGLRQARRRAVLLGGTLDLWHNEPSGTIFVWSVPLPRAD